MSGTESILNAAAMQEFSKAVLAEEGAEPEAPEATPEVAAEPVKPVAKESEAPEAIVAEPAAEGESEQPEPAAAENGDDDPKKPVPLPKWAKDRLAEKTFKQRQAERERDELAARLAELTRHQESQARYYAAQQAEYARRMQGQPQQPGQAPSVPPMPFPAMPPQMQRTQVPQGYVPASEVERIAAEQNVARAYNNAADAVHAAGMGKYGEAFEDALLPLQEMGATANPNFVNAAIATGAAHEVIYHLGQNPDEAERLANLPPAMMGVEMARLATKLTAPPVAKPKPVTKAPAPVRATTGSAKPSFDPETASDADFDKMFGETKAFKKLMGRR